jgi:hypothetical protein
MKVNCTFENLTPLIPLSASGEGETERGDLWSQRGGGEVIQQVSFLMFGSIIPRCLRLTMRRTWAFEREEWTAGHETG